MENNSKCGICQTVFVKLVMLRKHVRVDHKLQYANHRCPHCRFGCYINTDLESHKVQKHPDLKQYHCEVCNTGRVFFSESDYQVNLFEENMVFCYQNCSDLLLEKIVLVIEKKKLKFEAEGREFAKILTSLEQFVQMEKGQNNFW